MPKHPTIFVVFDTQCGGVDWILPVLAGAQEQNLGHLAVYFVRESNYTKSLKQLYPDLQESLKAVASDLFVNSDLFDDMSFRDKIAALNRNRKTSQSSVVSGAKAWINFIVQIATLPFLSKPFRASKLSVPVAMELLRRRLSGKDVCVTLSDNHYWSPFLDLFPASEQIIFPNGSLIPYTKCSQIPAHATLIVGGPVDLPKWRDYGVKCQVEPCGNPKYDPTWARKLRENAKKGPGTNKGFRILFLLMPLKKSTNKPNYCALARGLIEMANQMDMEVIVRSHPAQSFAELRRIFGPKFPSVRMSNKNAFSAAAEADVAVSFRSSAIMDAVVARIPVFEIFDYVDEHYPGTTHHPENSSYYRFNGISMGVNTIIELMAHLKNLRDSKSHHDNMAQSQYAAFQAHGGRSNEGSIDRALSLMRPVLADKPVQSNES